jgi:large subunit ribosomal protein L18
MPAATGPKYKVPLKRRRKFLTNYRKRIALLKSGIPRLVVRKSNKNVLAQIIIPGEKGDITLCSAHSNDLKQFGWPSRANLPTSYLVGMLCGLRAKKKGIKNAILDAGLSNGDYVFAAANGAKNFIEIKTKEIDEKRIKGEHIANYFKNLNEEERIKKFGNYIKSNINVEKLSEIFESVKEKIIRG